MSSIVHKVKDAVSGHHKSSAPHAENTTHNTRTENMTTGVSGENYGSTTGTTGLTGSHGTHASSGVHEGTGLHSNRMENTTSTGTSGLTGSHGTTGPVHNSHALNKADPRVNTTNTHGTSGLNSYSTTTGTSGLTGSHGTTGPVHDSHALNKADPRVNTTSSHGATGLNNHSTTTGTHNSSLPEGSVGPHSTRAGNFVDPTTDSDADGSRNMGMNRTTGTGVHGSTGSGLTGSHGTHGTTGLNNHSTTHGTTGLNNASGPGPAPSTAGPHRSDMLNKADPRVDSDMNGSKTLGRDQTYTNPTNTTNMMHKDPTDAAQVPPSVLQKHVGPPTAAHDHAGHGISGQEKHRGL